MTELMGNSLLAYTIADKPRSKFQRYRTTENGIEFLRESCKYDDLFAG
jgi:hypothetical protein